ncbi:MAG: Uma2 family endonuclease, partial [Myxococcota bacterium]
MELYGTSYARDSGELPRGYEIVDGALVRKAVPGYSHSGLQLWFGQVLAPYWGPGGQGKPGGWLFGSEADIELAPGHRYLPDVAGWRLDRVEPSDLRGMPIRIIPDWVCELLSQSTAVRDLGIKKHQYYAAGVTRYWVIEPSRTSLTVFERGSGEFQT